MIKELITLILTWIFIFYAMPIFLLAWLFSGFDRAYWKFEQVIELIVK